MDSPAPTSAPLQVGGPVSPAALYIARAADAEVLAELSEGRPCAVVAPAGAGKSSLALRLHERLSGAGQSVAYVSLTEVHGAGSAEEWFHGLAQLIAARLSLPDPAAFWKREHDLPPGMRWQRFLRVEVLGRLFGKVVLLLDSIDAAPPVLQGELPGALRAVRDARGSDATWARLTLCALGAGDAAELGIGDLGRTFVLPDFSSEEAAPLLPALHGVPDAELWLDAILACTGGHPSLTLRLVQALAEDGERPVEPSPSEATAHVEALGQRVLVGPGGPVDPLLCSIERRFRKDGPGAGALLGLYRRLLAQGRQGGPGGQARLPSHPDAPLQRALVATGLARVQGRDGDAELRPAGRLLPLIFDDAWAARRLAERELGAKVASWLERPEDPSLLLRGDELVEALRWAEGREDVSASERALLLRSLEEARREDGRRREEQQVKQDLLAAKERAAQRRLAMTVLGALLGLIALLLCFIAYLAYGRSVARREREAAERDRTAVRIHLKGATDDLERERAAHGKTQAELKEARRSLSAAQGQLDDVRREIGLKEARLKEVSGRVDSIFKKRIMVKGSRPGPDTKIDSKVVDNLMLTKGWPGIRRCYPLFGPLPRRLRVDVWVQPDGKVSDAGHSDEGAAKECVTQALRAIRFPSFAGAHYVRIFYVYEGPEKK